MRKSLLILATTLAMIGCQNAPEPKQQQTWYKGNTHTHTQLCGHADSHPDTVALWYLERDYNFLILSEHDQFVDPDSVNLPADRRADFILIPGEELSNINEVHSTAMNIQRVVHPHPDDTLIHDHLHPHHSHTQILQRQVDSTLSAGGKPILNHPNFGRGITAKDIQQVERLQMLELYNGHPQVYNWGTDELPSVEEKWDSLLTAGKKIYGVSSDDAHEFKTWGPEISNPGRGWVMVESDALTPDAITDALSKGKFYATSGVILSTVKITKSSYELTVDAPATTTSTSGEFVMGFKNEHAKAGFTIEFITDGGKVIQTVEGTSAKMDVPPDVTYLRAKVTYSTKRAGYMEQFFAWTQPVFLGD